MSSEVTTTPAAPARATLRFWALAAALLSFQVCLALWNIDAPFTRGHNGYNTGAYMLAARNSLRFETLLPYQFHTAPTPPGREAAYTHAPLGLHLHNVAAVKLLGDHPWSVRAASALQGVLVVLALLLVARALWSEAHALIAAATYTLLPINAIYINMTNHSTGFQLWAIVALACYVRLREQEARRWLLGMLLASALALQWDWPAYYVVALLMLHIALDMAARWRKARPRHELWQRFGWLAGLSLVVALSLAGQWLLVRVGAGHKELNEVFRSRQTVEAASFHRTLRVVPRLLFGWPLLGACALWLLDLARRSVVGQARARDLLPLAFLVAAISHFLLFKQSAWQHEYWLWPALPCVALAVAEMSVRGADALWRRLPATHTGWRAVRRIAKAAALCAAPLFLAWHGAQLVPRGRQTGGALWFFAPVRASVPQAYDSGHRELRLAEQVRRWTTRSTGVLVHSNLDRFAPEARFDVTLDRALHRFSGGSLFTPVVQGVDGWVAIGLAPDLTQGELFDLAGRHALTLYDAYFMIDMRRPDGALEVVELAPKEPSWLFRILSTSFELPQRPVRNLEREARLRALRAAHRAGARSAPDDSRFAKSTTIP